MATKYISPYGSDANTGASPDASIGSGGPWLTEAKALGSGASAAAGDLLVFAPNTYRETLTLGLTSPASEIRIIGDVRNEYGFKDGSGNLLRAGPVRFSAWTTDDKTAPSASSLVDLAGRDNLTFEDIDFIGGTGRLIDGRTAMSTAIKFKRCTFDNPAGSSSPSIDLSGGITANVALAWLFENCKWFTWGGYSVTAQSVPNSGSADWDLDVQFNNCEIFQISNVSAAVYITKTAAGSFFPGGIKFQNCAIISASWAILMQNGWSTSLPVKVYNSLIAVGSSSAALAVDTLGNLVEDYNVIKAQTLRSNVTAGTNTKTAYGLLLDGGRSQMRGFLARQYFSPLVDSPLLGFGSDASVTLSEDLLSRARPSGCGITWSNALKAVGPFEYHDYGRENTADASSGSCLELTGPGDQERVLAVDAVSTSPSFKVKYDGNYTGTNYPQIELVADASIGVSAQTLTATVAASGAYETLTFSAFTPTRKSRVRLRFKNRSGAGNGKCFFDK